MRNILMVALGMVLMALMGHTQQTTPAQARLMAQRLGLCTPFASGVKDGIDYPCQDCDITYVPLKGTAQDPQLFLIEISSAAHCGSGGCSGEVYERQGKGYKSLLGLFGTFERTIPRTGEVPDLVYVHHSYGSHDFLNNGVGDIADVWMQYRWNPAKRQYCLHDILRIEVASRAIPLSPWRKRLLQEWRQENRWMF
jgi:hypothetical protein